MKLKDKNGKRVKLTLKRFLGFLGSVLIVLYIIIFYYYYFGRNKVYAKEVNSNIENIKISNANEIEMEKIIEKNAKIGQREEFLVEDAVLEYITTYKNNSDLPKGTIQVIQEGREGKQQITKRKVYEKEELVLEEQVGIKITKASVNKIVEIGTGRGTSNYKAKIGDELYVTSDRLSVMVEANEQAQKIATLVRNEKLKVLEIQKAWYKISSGSTIGYVKAECTTGINPNSTYEIDFETTTAKSKSQLLNTLDKNMKLNKPSGLTLDQFKKVLTDSKDTKKIFEENAEYFYYIEKQYNINGIFVAAVGIHESAWGTSKIANDKRNLFGYGAYDSNPYNGAYNFSDYSESIDLLARVFVKYYLNPKGTAIYGGETAQGTYYNGSTLNGVNTRYATDKNWANAVYNHMKYLYNKL